MAKFIGLDVGSKTIGVALSDGYFARPYLTIKFQEDNFIEAANKLDPLLKEEKFEKIIVGYPKNMDGSSGHRIEMVELFLKNLYEICDVLSSDIVKIDERLTTRMAKSLMREVNMNLKKRKENKDQLAAKIILDIYLQQINM